MTNYFPSLHMAFDDALEISVEGGGVDVCIVREGVRYFTAPALELDHKWYDAVVCHVIGAPGPRRWHSMGKV